MLMGLYSQCVGVFTARGNYMSLRMLHQLLALHFDIFSEV